MKRQKAEVVTNKDANLNALQAAMKLLPGGTGDALSKILFERDSEAKRRRLENTVMEIHGMLKGREAQSQENEDYVGLFSKAAEPVATATNEDKRRRLRDLLFNSLFIPQGDPAWEESMHCLEVLQQIDPTGLYVIAKVAHADREEKAVCLVEFSGKQWLTVPKSGLGSNAIKTATDMLEDPKYNGILVEKQIAKLKQIGLITDRDQTITHGHFCTSAHILQLTAEGNMLVRWTVAEF